MAAAERHFALAAAGPDGSRTLLSHHARSHVPRAAAREKEPACRAEEVESGHVPDVKDWAGYKNFAPMEREVPGYLFMHSKYTLFLTT